MGDREDEGALLPPDVSCSAVSAHGDQIDAFRSFEVAQFGRKVYEFPATSTGCVPVRGLTAGRDPMRGWTRRKAMVLVASPLVAAGPGRGPPTPASADQCPHGRLLRPRQRQHDRRRRLVRADHGQRRPLRLPGAAASSPCRTRCRRPAGTTRAAPVPPDGRRLRRSVLLRSRPTTSARTTTTGSRPRSRTTPPTMATGTPGSAAPGNFDGSITGLLQVRRPVDRAEPGPGLGRRPVDLPPQPPVPPELLMEIARKYVERLIGCRW